MRTNQIKVFAAIAVFISVSACGTNENDNVRSAEKAPDRSRDADRTDLTLGEVDNEMAERGGNIVQAECQRCHAGPAGSGDAIALDAAFDRHDPQWLMDFMMNREIDAEGSDADCHVRKTGEGLSRDEARQVLEYMRTI
jgi:cytochrome c5